MTALALTSDLVLHSQLLGAAARTGVEVAITASIDELFSKAETTPPRLVILDLGHESFSPAELVPRLKAALPEATILAFGPHVHKQRLIAATIAGCNVVLSRGQFHSEMDAVLREHAQ